MTTIAIADDHELVRAGIRALLAQEGTMEVVGEASDGVEAIRIVSQHKPDILLLDISMPSLSGIDAIREVRRASKNTGIVILSMYQDESYVARAFREGATGYVTKQAPVSEIITAVREVASGRRFLGSQFSHKAIDAFLEKLANEKAQPWDKLTHREREVFRLAVEGHTNREIGERLFISSRTVESHRANMMHKLGVSSQTELVLFAARHDLLSAE